MQEETDTELRIRGLENALDYLKTIIAFANGRGGQIIFGLDTQSKDVTGIEEERLLEEIEAIHKEIAQNCTPAIVPAMYPKSLDGKTVLVVEIRPGENKPYFLKEEGIEEGVYYRLAGLTRKADFSLSKEMYYEADNRCYDRKIRKDLKISEEEITRLCKEMKEQAIKNCPGGQEKAQIKEITVRDLLDWGLLARDETGILSPCNAWIILTGQKDFSSRIRCALFQGDKRDRFLAQKECHGPLWQQVEQALEFVSNHIRIDSVLEEAGKKEYELPLEGIRELLVNAVLNCSYIQEDPIQVALFDNRLEITTPGGLMPNMTIERIKEGYTQIRNKALAQAFFYMRLIQGWGSGIPRLFRQMEEARLPKPEIIDMDSAIRINLYRNHEAAPELVERRLELARTKGLNTPFRSNGKLIEASEQFLERELSQQESLILDYIEDNGQIKSMQAAELLGLKLRRAQGILSQMVQSGLIKKMGATRNTYYIFNAGLLDSQPPEEWLLL